VPIRNGVPASTTSARRTSSVKRTPRRKTTLTKSKRRTIRPDVNISFRFSTSVVTRVTSWPVGRWSKKARSRRWRWRKRRSRRLAITTCPVLFSCATSR
jgi:hypothetical protein